MRHDERQVIEMDRINALTTRLRGGNDLAGTLAAGFDAFEAIRAAARECEDRAPELFAAFMMAAGAAVEGRNALLDAPSLLTSRGGAAMNGFPAVGVADAEQVADELAELAGLLAQRLSQLGAEAVVPGDRHACQAAAQSAREIHRLLARDSDATAAG
jgi:hypothetical protein